MAKKKLRCVKSVGIVWRKVDYWNQKPHNEKDSPTFDLTVWPLSGAEPASLLLNSDGGAKVKTS
jgi:hypothetical protein